MEYFREEGKEDKLVFISLLSPSLLVLLLFYTRYYRQGFYEEFYNILLFSAIIVMSQIPSIFIYKENCKNKCRKESLEQTVKDLKDLNCNSRIKIHDFKNHLTVIHGLTVKGKNDILENYIESLIGATQYAKLSVDTGIEEIDLFLEAKYSYMKDNDIELCCQMENKLSDISINSFNLLKILGNIIDNAIDELISIDKDKKKIVFRVEESNNKFKIIISNNGRKIPKDTLVKIFKKGVSTKEGEARGCGLYIVKTIVEKARGGIQVESDEAETRFLINIPKACGV